MKVKGFHRTVLFAFLILLALGSTASARTLVYEGDIEEGQVYQLNNYVIEITDIFLKPVLPHTTCTRETNKSKPACWM